MIVLDTHVLIWWVNESSELTKKVRDKITYHQRRKSIYLSSITLWEIAMLVRKGRLSFSISTRDWISKVLRIPYMNVYSLDPEVLTDSVMLDQFNHTDPVDRMIIATTQKLSATLITKDKKILDYPLVDTFWS